MCQEARLDTPSPEGSATVSATTTQASPKKLPQPSEEACTFMPLDLDDMPQIPMPLPNHPGGELVHPWED